jgi:aminocarboxymuconate-semialdehyde decarboxylase
LEEPGLQWSNVGDHLAQMDQSGVDVQALSINPYWYRAERDAVTELIRVQNEALVDFCASQQDRFIALATAALQYPDLAAKQVERAVKTLGFRGIGVGGSVAGEDLANWSICDTPLRKEKSGVGLSLIMASLWEIKGFEIALMVMALASPA